MDDNILAKFVEELHFNLISIKIDAQHGVVPAEWEKCINSIDFVIKSMYKDYKKEYKL